MKFKCGLYVGRFQPLHIGHTSIIDQMLEECEEVIIAVGSAQESGTERNPLSYPLRQLIITETYFEYLGRMYIVPIVDRENYSDDSSWGDYLFDRLLEHGVPQPDVIYEGEEDVRENWYDNQNVSIIQLPRTVINISGTELRHAILNDHVMTSMLYLPSHIFVKFYDTIRKEIQNAAVNSKRNPVD